jgi:hypothetical protein
MNARNQLTTSNLILLTDLTPFNHEHPKNLMVFVVDQNKLVIQLLESNIEHEIVIYFGIKYKYTNLVVC